MFRDPVEFVIYFNRITNGEPIGTYRLEVSKGDGGENN